jgi:predicted transcriptional regulator
MEAKVFLGVEMPLKLKRAVEEAAHAEGRTVSDIARIALRRYIDQETQARLEGMLHAKAAPRA